jgi:hypothetical protein
LIIAGARHGDAQPGFGELTQQAMIYKQGEGTICQKHTNFIFDHLPDVSMSIRLLSARN